MFSVYFWCVCSLCVACMPKHLYILSNQIKSYLLNSGLIITRWYVWVGYNSCGYRPYYGIQYIWIRSRSRQLMHIRKKLAHPFSFLGFSCQLYIVLSYMSLTRFTSAANTTCTVVCKYTAHTWCFSWLKSSEFAVHSSLLMNSGKFGSKLL